MELVNNPHDKFFKETFSNRDNVIDFVQGTFPDEILRSLDLSTLALDNNSYIDEELKEYFSDVVYNCFYKGKELKISLLFEHKSYPEKFPHLQVLKYLLKIWESNIKQTEKLSSVIPVILYHGRETWKVRRFREYFEDRDNLFHRFIPEFDYLLTDLSQYSNDQIKNIVFHKVSLEIALLIMRNIYDENQLKKHLKDFLEIGREYFEEEEGLKFLESAIRYLYNSTEIESDKVIETIKEISMKGGELVVTTAMNLMQKGKAEGKVEGRIEGEKELLIRQIEYKWGKLRGDIRDRIGNINTQNELDLLGKRVIICDSIDDLFSNE